MTSLISNSRQGCWESNGYFFSVKFNVYFGLFVFFAIIFVLIFPNMHSEDLENEDSV